MLHTICIGNAGGGKSTILNAIAGEKLFESGLSSLGGLTDKHEAKEHNGITFHDVPAVDELGRKDAFNAIADAMKQNGRYKVLFIFSLVAGRAQGIDLTTINLVLQAAPDIKEYGLIFNKLQPEERAKFSSVEAIVEILMYLDRILVIPPKHMHFFPEMEELHEAANKLPPPGTELNNLQNWFNRVGEVQIKADNVGEMDVKNFMEQRDFAVATERELSEATAKNDELKQEVEKMSAKILRQDENLQVRARDLQAEVEEQQSKEQFYEEVGARGAVLIEVMVDAYFKYKDSGGGSDGSGDGSGND